MRFFVLVIQLARDGVDKGEARGQFVGRKLGGQQFGAGLFKSNLGGREMGATSEAFHTPDKLPIAGVAGDKFHSIHNPSSYWAEVENSHSRWVSPALLSTSA